MFSDFASAMTLEMSLMTAACKNSFCEPRVGLARGDSCPIITVGNASRAGRTCCARPQCKDDKLLLAFDAVALSKLLGREVSLGKIIHGDDLSTLKVKTSALASEVRKHLEKIVTLLSSPAPPDLILNRHCAFLDFLRSGERDIHAFAAGRRGRRRRMQTTPHRLMLAASKALTETQRPDAIAWGTERNVTRKCHSRDFGPRSRRILQHFFET